MSPRDTWSRVTSRRVRSGRRWARGAAIAGLAGLVASAPLSATAVKPTGGAPHVPLTAARPFSATTISAAPFAWVAGGPLAPSTASLPWSSLSLARWGDLDAAAAASTPQPGRTIPASVRSAYVKAETTLGATQPGCHLPWWVLAGIGHVESGHAAGGRIDATGRTVGDIRGPVLDGTTAGTAIVADTDAGTVDGDTAYDRAVGPMQFLPATWNTFGADGNADGRKDPHNVYDAALAAGRYLCSGGRDLRDAAALRTAVLAYNPSEKYVSDVLGAGQAYRDGRAVPAPWTPPREAPAVAGDPPVSTPRLTTPVESPSSTSSTSNSSTSSARPSTSAASPHRGERSAPRHGRSLVTRTASSGPSGRPSSPPARPPVTTPPPPRPTPPRSLAPLPVCSPWPAPPSPTSGTPSTTTVPSPTTTNSPSPPTVAPTTATSGATGTTGATEATGTTGPTATTTPSPGATCRPPTPAPSSTATPSRTSPPASPSDASPRSGASDQG